MRSEELLRGFNSLWAKDTLKFVENGRSTCNETEKCCGQCFLERELELSKHLVLKCFFISVNLVFYFFQSLNVQFYDSDLQLSSLIWEINLSSEFLLCSKLRRDSVNPGFLNDLLNHFFIQRVSYFVLKFF